MKIRDLITLLLLIAIIVGPWLVGWYDALTMGIVGFSAISAGVLTELLMRPRKSITQYIGEHYQIGRTNKGIRIESKEGEIILDRILVRAGFIDTRGRLIRIKLKFRNFDFEKETLILTQKFGNTWLELKITLQVKDEKPEINMTMEGFIHENIPAGLLHTNGMLRLEYMEVRLAFPYDLPLRELYLKNRTRRYRQLFGPIWLDKQGVSLGKRNRCFHIYHVPGISSLSYKRYPQLLSVFLDHVADHRFVKATASETNPDYLDFSHTLLKSGDKISGHCTFLCGAHPVVQPTIWHHQSAHDATLIWTTHPDNGTLNTTKAVTLGDSALATEDPATGGFAAHGIPLTMGVFHSSSHPRHIALFNHPDSEHYRSLVSRLHLKNGFEIALHTASDQCSSREETEESLKYITQEPGAKTWIDHSANLQRASLSGSGTEPLDEHYILDLLEKYEIGYVWHYGSELKYLKEFDILDDAYGIDLLQAGRPGGSGNHTPFFWKHPTQLGSLITWKTQAIGRLRHFPMTGLHWLVWFGRNLDPLIRSRGVAIIHDYPFWRYTKKHINGNGIYRKAEGATDSDDRWVIDPDFDLLLQRISVMQKQHQLNCSTIQEFLDYQLQMENITFEFVDISTMRIVNHTAGIARPILAYPSGTTPYGDLLSYIRPSGNDQLYQLTLAPFSETLIVAD